MLEDSDDLEQSIVCLTEAIFLPLPRDRLFKDHIAQILFSLTVVLVCRATNFRRPEDVTRSIIYLRYLRGRSPEVFGVPPNELKIWLVRALRARVKIELGNARQLRQDIEEMAVLCHELLKTDMSMTSVTSLIMHLAEVIQARPGSLNELPEPSDKVIECLREASILLPDSHDVSLALAWSLFHRFQITPSDDDYEEATTILDKVARIPGLPGDKLTQNQVQALQLVSMFARARADVFERPEYEEEGIHRIRTLLAALPPEDSHRLEAKFSLAHAQKYRSYGSEVASGLEEAYFKSIGVSDHPPFQDLTASLTQLNDDSERMSEGKHFLALLSLPRITDEAEVEEAVKYCRLLIASSDRGSHLAIMAGVMFANLLRRAFFRTHKIEYLNEAISVFRHMVKFDTRGLFQSKFLGISGLILSISTRFDFLRLEDDFNEIMQLFPMVVNDERGSTPRRFQLSCKWARIARLAGHPSTSTAYDCAISLMQDCFTFAPTLDKQHSRLVAMRDDYETLPLDYASYHVSTGQLQRAIETLEQGRALIWSEMRGLRTSIDQIRAMDSHLADNFAAVNRDLEMLTLTISANNSDSERDDGTVGMDQFGRLVVRQRELLDDRNELISQIQVLPGFETFLKSPSFDKLHSAAARGPVIIINHSRWRSDIIILHYAFPPSLISTANDFYDRANNMRDYLLGARMKGLESKLYDNALGYVLKELYELVGRQVIQRLNELRVPEQSRVWWCPTSVFCSLPLHAMGPIPQLDGRPRYFLDLYIPSYTPTLSALIESNNPGSDTLEMPSILLVSPPDASLPGASGEMQVVQARSFQVTTLSSETANPSTVLEHLRDHRFIHIVSHGILEPGKPFDASFELYGGRRLSLLDIVRSRLPEADFAFLSACRTAELTEDSITDEGIHLTAAMQYCGFRSVAGTMWELLDIDGEVIAKKFYKRVFSDRQQGVRYYERTAEALRDAVIHLREKKQRRETPMTLERWVNFVHYGA